MAKKESCSPCSLPIGIKQRLEGLRIASQALRSAESAKKNDALSAVAAELDRRRRDVIDANGRDLAALKADTTSAFRDRLTLNDSRINQMIESLRQVASLPDPVNEEVERRTLSNGLLVRRMRSPLGVLLMIFESRPNVALESFSLAFKSGNAIILRGGKESMRTTGVIYEIIGRALKSTGLPPECVWGITDPDRSLTELLLEQNKYIDVVVPRGGDALIEFVVQNARMPIIKNDRGLCHVYLHEDADKTMAVEIVANAKTHRPGVCNAMETLLVHRSRAAELLPAVHERLAAANVEWYCCPETLKHLSGRGNVKPAGEASFDTEYLDLKLSCKVVGSLNEALEHIEKHGSRHSESIVTANERAAREFQSRVDAAAVYWNASTRFTDGFELGLGGELGISTQKLHVRGPVGLRELTSARWVIDGTGQTRR